MDDRQLETVSKFASFIAFLEDPAKFKQMIDDAQARSAELKELLGAKATVESAEKFAAKVDAEIGQRYAELESAQKRFDTSSKIREDSLFAKEEEVGALLAKLKEDQQKLEDKAKEQAKAQEKLDVREKDVSAREQAVGKKDQELADYAQSLKDKAEQMKLLLGA